MNWNTHFRQWGPPYALGPTFCFKVNFVDVAVVLIVVAAVIVGAYPGLAKTIRNAASSENRTVSQCSPQSTVQFSSVQFWGRIFMLHLSNYYFRFRVHNVCRERGERGKTTQQHHQQRRSDGGGRVPAPVAVPSGDIRQNSTTANGAKSNAFCVKLIIRLTWPPNARGERERGREIAKNKYRIMHDIYTYIVCMLYICRMAQPEVCRPRGGSALLCLGHLFTCILRAGAE